jgi:N-acetylneuraminic acid mutarotase
MIVWGGYAGGTNFLQDGGRYHPAANSWTTLSTNGAPAGRYLHSAVWTDSEEMIVWGGATNTSSVAVLNDGGRYRPATDTWTAVATNGAPASRQDHTAVWTGSEMIIWGGLYYSLGDRYRGDGGRYNPAANTWTAVALSGAPAARAGHTAVWTGSEMIIWGGDGDGYDYFNDTWAYTPGKTMYLYLKP